MTNSDVAYLDKNLDQDLVLDQVVEGGDSSPNAKTVSMPSSSGNLLNINNSPTPLQTPIFESVPSSQSQSHFVQITNPSTVQIVNSPINSTSRLTLALGGLKLVSTQGEPVDITSQFHIVGSTELPVLSTCTNQLTNLQNLQLADGMGVPIQVMTNTPESQLYVLSLGMDSSDTNEKENINGSTEIPLLVPLTSNTTKIEAETTPELAQEQVKKRDSPDYDVNNIEEPHRSSTPADQFENDRNKSPMDETIVAGHLPSTQAPPVVMERTSDTGIPAVPAIEKKTDTPVTAATTSKTDLPMSSETTSMNDEPAVNMKSSPKKLCILELNDHLDEKCGQKKEEIKIAKVKKKVSRQLFVPKEEENYASDSEVHNQSYCRDWIEKNASTGHSKDEGKMLSDTTVQSDFENGSKSLNSEFTDSLDLTSVSRREPVAKKKNSVMATLAENHNKSVEIKTKTTM